MTLFDKLFKETEAVKTTWNKKYTTIAVYAFLVLVMSAIAIFLISQISAIWSFANRALFITRPIIYGLVFAYLINPLVVFFEKKVLFFLGRER